jgi:hypothetical protein
MTQEDLGFLVAEVKVKKTIKFAKEEGREPIKRGSIATVSALDHPTDVKLWPGGTYQISPEYFDLKKPVRIIRGL